MIVVKIQGVNMEGETITCRIASGGKIEVTFEDRVFPDASAHQYEAGWWVFHPDGTTATQPGDYPFNDFFLSESGVLYDYEEDPENKDVKGFTKAVGYHVPWVRRVQKADEELEQLIREDEAINRSFDAYR
jgi:hypothetical protein